MNTTSLSSSQEVVIKYVCGIDIGSQSCSGCICRPSKQVVVKPLDFANTKEGWNVLLDRLRQLEASPEHIVIGMEATARYHENLYHELERQGYQLRLLHPGQTHHFHQQQGLRAKTDRLDAMTMARLLPSRGRAHRLYSERADRHVPRSSALAYPTERGVRPLSEPDPRPGSRALPRVHTGDC